MRTTREGEASLAGLYEVLTLQPCERKLGDVMRNFIREKKIYCGANYMEVDIYPLSENQLGRKKGERSKKKKVTIPKQKKLNEKNARRKFKQLCETNFGQGDMHVTLTYSEETLPETVEEAKKMAGNYIRRIKRLRKKKGLPDLKYVMVTAVRTEEDANEEEGEKPVRIHHHILMNQGLSRDEVEETWRLRKKKGEKKGQKIGYANADRIQPDYNTGIQQLASYLAGNPSQKRRWTCSQNLKRPEERTNDYKYSRRRVIKLCTAPLDVSFWEKMYPGWTILDKDRGFVRKYNDITGWSIYLKLRPNPYYKRQ